MKKYFLFFGVLVGCICPALEAIGVKQLLGALVLASNAMQGKSDVAIVQRLYTDSGKLVAEQAFYKEGLEVLERENGELVVEHGDHSKNSYMPSSALATSRDIFEALRKPVIDRYPVIEVSQEYSLNGGQENIFTLPKIEPDDFLTYMRSKSHIACQGIPLVTQADDIMYIDSYVRAYGLVYLSGTDDEAVCETFRKQFFLDAIEQVLQERLLEDDITAETPVFRLVEGNQLEFVCKLAHVGHAKARGELGMSKESIKEQLAVATYDISSRVPKIQRGGKQVFGSVLVLNSGDHKNLEELVNKCMDGKTEEDLREFFK